MQRYLTVRLYARRFSLIVFETCVCLMATIVLTISAIDNGVLTSDPILFAITFLLVRCARALRACVACARA
jgi:hypothetical protein